MVLVRQLLASSEPVAVALGPRLLTVYNDAFGEIIGVEALGERPARPLADICAAFWPRLAPLVHRAYRSAEVVLLDDQLHCRARNGTTEEAYLRLACRPFQDESRAIGGVVVTVSDRTEQVISLRRTRALREIAAAAAAPKCSVSEACERVLAVVARHSSDLPFAMLYLRSSSEDAMRLAATAGVPRDGPASPEVIRTHSSNSTSDWPIASALRRNEPIIIDNLFNRFGVLPAGEWPFAPRVAVAVPITSPGRHAPEAVLICGVSARHGLDAEYGAFIDLIAKQIAAAITGGRVHEEEERAAKARAAARVAQAKRRARLRALKARFAGVLEERTRLAREIHDTLLQGVTGIALQLRAVLPDVHTSPDTAADVLKGVMELAERTSSEARQAVWDMRPTKRPKHDLARMLELAARRLVAATSIELRMVVSGQARALPAPRQAAVIRIVQEAVANAVRHAEARVVRIEVVFENRHLRIVVSDDGRGFTVKPDFHAYEGHWGLLGMQERAEGFGGALVVRSIPLQGTTIMLVLPSGGSGARAAGRGE